MSSIGEYECRVNDFETDPLVYINPQAINLSYKKLSVTYIWSVNTTLPSGTKYYVYFNGDVIDRDGLPFKEYKISKQDVLSAYAFAVVPVLDTANSTDYDPLCGVVINMFNNVNKDIILASDNYVCDRKSSTYYYFDKLRKNYVSVDLNAVVKTVKVGQKVKVKSSGSIFSVLKVQDYRFDGQFDRQAFQFNPRYERSCAPYPALSSAVFIKTSGGVFALQDVDIL